MLLLDRYCFRYPYLFSNSPLVFSIDYKVTDQAELVFGELNQHLQWVSQKYGPENMPKITEVELSQQTINIKFNGIVDNMLEEDIAGIIMNHTGNFKQYAEWRENNEDIFQPIKGFNKLTFF